MSESTNSPQESNSFADRMAVLTQELGLAIRWQRPGILMVAYGSEYVRADSVSMLENFLMDRDQKIVWIHATDSAVNSLGFWNRILDCAEDVVFFVDGLSDLAYQHGFRNILNHHSDLFIEKNARLVFWLTYKEASAIAYQAPSLWARRQRLIELVASPKPEQILQNALESAWQGTGEYNDQFDDTEAKISLRESFLTDLPVNTETTSIRANLLLTLGILNWRKGDYESASDLLQNALKVAARMQDTWFEAECFNAVALVKSSLGKNEEAVDAYKQAISLAPDQIFAWNNLGNLCLKINRNHEAMIAFQKAIEQNAADPIAWNGMGDVYSRSEYIDDAIAAYRKSISLAPLLPHPWNGLGEIYARSGRPNDAVLAFQKAIQLNHHFSLPWLGLARLYTKQERYRDAVKSYQQALILDAQNSVTWNALGCVYLEARQYDDAIETLAKAVELDHGFGWAYSNLGLAHASHDKLKESIPLYLKSLELLRDQDQRNITWNRLANSYRMLNDYENAIKAYQKADSLNEGINQTPRTNSEESVDQTQGRPEPVSEIESAPETESAPPMERSEERSSEEQVPESNRSLDEEIPYWVFRSEAEPGYLSAPLSANLSDLFGSEVGDTAVQTVTATQEIGGLSMQMTLPLAGNVPVSEPARFSAADTSRRRAPKANHNEARMWNEKGNLLFRAGAAEDAIRAYNKAIKSDRSFGWPYCNLGIAYLHLGRYAEAILLLQKSLELLATNIEQAVAWNELGNLYRCLNDYHNAVAAYQRADELDPNHAGVRDAVEYLHAEPNTGDAQVWSQLGDSFFKAGAYAEGADCYRKVTEMDPLDAWAFSNLALSLTFQSKFDEAVPYYLTSIELFKDDKEKANAWNRLGNVYRRLDDYENAIAAYQNAVKLNNENTTLLTRARFSLLGNCFVD